MRLYTFKNTTRLHVLAVEGGSVRQWTCRPDGSFRGSRRPFDFAVAVREGREVPQTRDGQLLLFPETRRSEAYVEFVRTLPADVLQRVITYPPELQYRLFCFFVRVGKAATDLHDGGAHALCAALAGCDRFAPGTNASRSMRRWACLRQHDAFARLGWPPEKRIAKFMHRVPASDCTWSVLHGLRRVASGGDAAILGPLSHLQRISASVLWAITRPDGAFRRFSPRFLGELSATNRRAVVEVQDCFRIVEATEREIIRLGGRLTGPKVFESVEQLQAARGTATEDYIACLHAAADLSGIGLTAPPWADEPGFIRWLRTAEELRREGQDMEHCVFGYLPAAHAGYVAIASVASGAERATLRMDQNETAEWRIGELRGLRNADVSENLRCRVASWLEEQERVSSVPSAW